MNGGYFPVVVNPKLRRQTLSDELQTPFFFGGSQIPNAMSVRRGQFKGSGMKGNGRFEDFFTKTIPSVFQGKAREYASNPQNIYADVLDAESPIKIPVLNKNPEAILMRGKGFSRCKIVLPNNQGRRVYENNTIGSRPVYIGSGFKNKC